MEPVSLTTRTDVVDGRAVVSVSGDVDLASAGSLREALGEALALSSTVIVDVAGMGFIDSSGLSALIWGHHQARDAGGSLSVRRPSPMLRRLLEITRLETVLVIAESEDQDSTVPES
jgi:anti-sigma B factor antagonist